MTQKHLFAVVQQIVVTPDLSNTRIQKKAVKADRDAHIYPILVFARPMLPVSAMEARLHSVIPEKMEHCFSLSKQEITRKYLMAMML